ALFQDRRFAHETGRGPVEVVELLLHAGLLAAQDASRTLRRAGGVYEGEGAELVPADVERRSTLLGRRCRPRRWRVRCRRAIPPLRTRDAHDVRPRPGPV